MLHVLRVVPGTWPDTLQYLHTKRAPTAKTYSPPSMSNIEAEEYHSKDDVVLLTETTIVFSERAFILDADFNKKGERNVFFILYDSLRST